MKNCYNIIISIILFYFISISTFAQINDTVSHIGDDCLGKDYVNNFQFYFENDSLFIGGEVLMNCWDHNYLFREVRQDSVFLIAADTCMDNCTCHFNFSTGLVAPDYNEIYVSIGYLCLIGDYQYEHYLDTIINNPLVNIQSMGRNNDFIKISPNPIINQLNISLEDSGDYIKNIKIFQINGREVYNRHCSNKSHLRIIDFSHFDKGVYFISIESNKEIFIKKIARI
ncbi:MULTISPECIES: T9SS type A sorting domain-containing protein [unclassified Lentimicrobium]|uniref:T9SS type A sorting domain-containing protein n=1 Tax=unclassified Lentimicrobium TaxID=2677434 RepID=UPI0015580D9D|nr:MULTISPECIES: T9SS type A sorting domain-containing protein [unclassified Lentimicrobium]NPD45489.1 T9SS type A sorting domain-containing protein [Lentimicrobium sp. S6]NPD83999.1 T9SS type A sorting domain-containing protein [Lentimicrobium sp. L6]